MADPFKGTAFEGFRHVTDYREIEHVLKARSPAPRRRPKADHIEAGSLLKINGDRHTHRRRLEGALFKPAVLESYSREVLEPTIDRVIDDLAAERAADGLVHADLVAVGQRLIMEVTGIIIGLDDIQGKGDEIYRLLVDFTEGIKVEYSTGDQSHVVARADEAKQRYWMAYKDEYEVARLHLDEAVRLEAEAAVGAAARITVLLHPPVLRALGIRRKIAFGPWTRPMLRVLRAGRRLRGTPVDPFGLMHVRRIERDLRDEYIGLVDRLVADISRIGLPSAIRIAALPAQIRGYEQIKLASVARYRAALEAELRGVE